MVTDYVSRLGIPITGDETTEFESDTGRLLARGYTRIVIGGRGPYVEFEKRHLALDTWRFVENGKHHYFLEHRSFASNIMCYEQLYRVDYADYVPGMFYVSPFEMYVGNKLIIEPLRKKK